MDYNRLMNGFVLINFPSIVSKSFFSNFSNMKNNVIPFIRITSENLPLMSLTKILLVIIDDNLSFSYHINRVCKMISDSIGVIKKVPDYLPQAALRSLYYTIVHSHVICAIEV